MRYTHMVQLTIMCDDTVDMALPPPGVRRATPNAVAAGAWWCTTTADDFPLPVSRGCIGASDMYMTMGVYNTGGYKC